MRHQGKPANIVMDKSLHFMVKTYIDKVRCKVPVFLTWGAGKPGKLGTNGIASALRRELYVEEGVSRNSNMLRKTYTTMVQYRHFTYVIFISVLRHDVKEPLCNYELWNL